jgi:NAD(P)-dependent dehydrogenase (short-subunit alcohol dehydrogenase family)
MFSNSTVVLTGVGAEGQVGEVVARAFADLGSSLVLVDRTPDNVQARADGIAKGGGKARGYACDLTDPAAIDSLIKEVRSNHGDAVSAFVHMAGGFAMSGPVADSVVDVWHRQIAINLTTAYLASRAFLPLVRAGKGSLVFFASEAALPGASAANRSAYAVAKTGVVTLMRAIAAEEQKTGTGVRANAVAPTSIRTAANVTSMGSDVRYVEREEVAAVVTYLCSAQASAVNGAVIPLS